MNMNHGLYNISLAQKKEERRTGFIYAGSLFFFLGISLFLIHENIKSSLWQDTDKEQAMEIEAMGEHIHDIFTRVEVYLLHVSNLYTVRQILKKETPAMRRDVEHFFSRVVETNLNRLSPKFDQIRLLDLNGMEIARVNKGRGKNPIIVPITRLQNKSNRYYFKEAVNIPENQIYMSPLDLNIEHGKVEKPHKPIIRFAVPVFDLDGTRLGLLILNYLAQQLFNDIEEMNIHPGDQWILVNQDGYYLHGPDPGKNFSFMFPGKKLGFFSDHPDLWNQISSSSDKKFIQPQALYYRKDIIPFGKDTSKKVSDLRKWTLLMQAHKETIKDREKLLNHGLFLGGAVFGPILMILGWLLGKSKVKNRWYVRSLEECARHDGMTGLYTHEEAMGQLQYQINLIHRTRQPLSIGYLDLNDLKPVNDTLGHKSGDRMIISAAKAIKTAIRKTDIAARVGGDEFLIIFVHAEKANAWKVIERIGHLYTRDTNTLLGRDLTLSWGVSQWKGDEDNPENLIHRADKKMYAMKKEMKNKEQI